MQHHTTKKLYTYWNDVRGDRVAPGRFEIAPADIADLLPETFLLERTEDQGFRYRLAGTRICEHFKADLRGTDFLDQWTEDDLAGMRHHVLSIADRGAVGVFQVAASGASGRLALFEILLLPLTHTRGTIDRCLGSIVPLAPPDWLGSEPLTRKRLLQHQIIWPEGRPRAGIKKVANQMPFLPHVRTARIVRQDRRQFRVYEGGLSARDD